MSYTEIMLEAEKLAHLTGEERGDWFTFLTSEGVGEDE